MYSAKWLGDFIVTERIKVTNIAWISLRYIRLCFAWEPLPKYFWLPWQHPKLKPFKATLTSQQLPLKSDKIR